jgi:hypothetical protein
VRSLWPLPANPWPHGMVISVDDLPHPVIELLFIRSAWGIAQDLELPALDPQPRAGNSAVPETASRDDWSQRWKHQWQRIWDWYVIHDPGIHPTQEQLRSMSRPGQPLNSIFPPFWAAEHGDAGIDHDALRDWENLLMPRHLRHSLEEEPERVCLPALIKAWETGIEEIVTPPYAGYFAQRLSRKVLVVSAATRADPGLYKRALDMASSAAPGT